MSQLLAIPVQLDALYVSGVEMGVVGQNMDFPSMPYFDPSYKREVNADQPYLSEALANQTFHNKNLRLGHGIHLHWALPDALTHGDSQLNFPQVPDRWVVTRWHGNKQERSWVVESNYLYPPEINKQGTAISMPSLALNWELVGGLLKYSEGGFEYPAILFPEVIRTKLKLDTNAIWKPESEQQVQAIFEDVEIPELAKQIFLGILESPLNRSGQPYRYMGRKMPLEAWQSAFPDTEYYPSLTATGYGDPTFAAFYPNCFSVFGLHDPNPGESLDGLRYELMGWYSDPENDILSGLVKNAENNAATIKEKFDWVIAKSDTPDRLICYAGIQFQGDGSAVPEDPDVSVTVAETPGGALSAFLSQKLSRNEAEQGIIEDQLDALQMSFQLEDRTLDKLSRFKELKHESGFHAHPGEKKWTYRREVPNESQMGENGQQIPDLSVNIANLIQELNELQLAYDQSWENIESLRQQLFADWYKYMICVYPPDGNISNYPSPDLIKHFIEKSSLGPLEEKIRHTGKIEGMIRDKRHDTEEGDISGIQLAANTGVTSLAGQIAQKVDQIVKLMEQEENELNTKHAGTLPPINYHLVQIPGPRFWKPNDPVVLIEGEDTSLRHGLDGILEGDTFNLEASTFQDRAGIQQVVQRIHNLLEGSRAPRLKTWQRQAWNPFLLEWQVQLFPTGNRSNLDGSTKYATQFITENYEAPILNPDLELIPGKGKLAPGGMIYSGSSILTHQAVSQLEKSIEHQLIEKLGVFSSSNAIKLADYPGEKSLKNPVYTMIQAYEALANTRSLSQALNGFNEALLMHKVTPEFNLDDPQNFFDYRHFSRRTIADALDDQPKLAPAPQQQFNPIRSGCMKMIQLRLVDTFGQTRSLTTDQLKRPQRMKIPNADNLIKMTPRLAQPTRLNFRWLHADQEKGESHVHASSSPICGWLMTNLAENSLMAYDANGRALGYFKANQWVQAIDSDLAKSIDEVQNPHLKRVLKFIENSITKEQDFIKHFSNTIEDGLDNIQKDGAPISGIAHLIGKPLAIVRASLNLELQGSPAINQDWNIFRRDLAKTTRTHDQFTHVQFPVRLGEYGQLNDGLIGYWLETKNDQGEIEFAHEEKNDRGRPVMKQGARFYSPQSDYIDTAIIESRFESMTDGAINFYQSLSDAPQQVTMLMDPQGVVHATVGILPNKSIDIPQQLYKDALQNMEISFLQAPIITTKDKINLPIEPLQGYDWSWVEKRRNGEWLEFFDENRLQKVDWAMASGKIFGHAVSEPLWQHLISPGISWLKPIGTDRNLTEIEAIVINQEDRKSNEFRGEFRGMEEQVEKIMEEISIGIDPPSLEANYVPSQLREGWLKLRKKN